MAQKFFTPITIKQLASAGSDALTVFLDGEVYGRVKLEAGGRISWSDGAGTYDTNLYRDGANTLATDDVLKALAGVVTMTVAGVPSAALPNGALAVDTTNHQFYFRSNNAWNLVEGGGGATVIAQSSPPAGQDEGTLWLDTDTFSLSIYYDGEWVQVSSSSTLDLEGGNQLDDIFEAEVTNGVMTIFDGAGV
jgi:hypothetical protein